ncbi:MAG: GNAT family N-acetyltransferase, partial [Gammaproteobacteria bacterium]|nr:GNAT family N-acetyltransferase [Gammaproteobacteria bacterium]
MISGYRVSSHREEMDFDAIHTYISSTYWAEGIPKETFKKALDNSLCFGVFSSEGKQVGFARMITDQATFAYLADVFIDEAHRGKGLSKWLMQEVHDHPSLQGLR